MYASIAMVSFLPALQHAVEHNMKKLITSLFFILLFGMNINAYAVVENLSPTADTAISQRSWEVDVNYGTSSNIFLGESNQSAYILKFDLSGLAGKTINYAYLKIYETMAGYQHQMYAYRLLRTDWSENQATWNIYKTGSNWGTAGSLNASTDYTATNTSHTGATNGGWMTWDVTALVQDMINNNTNSIAVRGLVGSNTSYDYFYTRESSTSPPVLQVSYPGVPGQPTKYYIRTDGGTSSQCDGTHDAPQSGATDSADPGILPDCAFNHLSWAIGTPTGDPSIMMPGDEVEISDGDYTVGYGMPNSNCDSNNRSGCVMNKVPESDETGNTTKIYGEGWNSGCTTRPRMLGTNGVGYILRTGSYTDVRCLEFTDSNGCMNAGPQRASGKIDNESSQDSINCIGSPWTGNDAKWASKGLWIDLAENAEYHDVSVHGMAYYCVSAYGLSGTSVFDNVDIGPCGSAGWDADDCSGSACSTPYTGTVYFINGSSIKWAGCGERARATGSDPSTTAGTPHDCCDQEQGCYGDGMGFDAAAGSWVFQDAEVSFNTSDGFDLLYSHTGTITMTRVRAQGNVGASIKSSMPQTTIENSVILGDCNQWKKSPWTFGSQYAPGRSGTNCDSDSVCDSNENYQNCGDCWGMNYCRAGTNIALSEGTNKIYNSTLSSTFDIIVALGGDDCTGTTVDFKNNIIYGHDDDYSDDNTAWFYQMSNANGNNSCPNWNNSMLTEDYNIFYHIKDGANYWPTKGANSSYQDPKVVGPIYSSRDNPYVGSNYFSSFYLASDSPARDTADETVGVSNGNDFNNYSRGASWDIGGIEYGSSAQEQCTANGGVCTLGSNCCSTFCCSSICSDGACPSFGKVWYGTLNGSL
jgi:hypothetical protein